MGREIGEVTKEIKTLINKLVKGFEGEGFEFLYGDTDSLFFKLGGNKTTVTVNVSIDIEIKGMVQKGL